MPTDKRVDKRSALFDSTELESAKKLSDEIKKLKKEHKDNNKKLTAAEAQQLLQLYEQLGLELKDQYASFSKKESNGAKSTKKLMKKFAKDYSALRKYKDRLDKSDNKNGFLDVEEFFENSRTRVIKLSEEGYKKLSSVGAGMNTRLKVSFLVEDEPVEGVKKGDATIGFFTESQPNFHPHRDEMMKQKAEILKKALSEKYPDAKDFIKDLKIETADSFSDGMTEELRMYSYLFGTEYNIKNSINNLKKDMTFTLENNHEDEKLKNELKILGKIKNEQQFFAYVEFNSGIIKENFSIDTKDNYGIQKNVDSGKRNALASEFADIFGCPESIAYAEKMDIVTKVNGEEVIKKGVMMMPAKGEDPFTFDSTSKVAKRDGFSYEDSNGLALSVAKLQLLDYLIGNSDRHTGNFFVQMGENGKVKFVQGIDNDTSFGATNEIANHCYGVPLSKMRIIPKSMADAIKNTKPEVLEVIMQGYGLNDREVANTIDRFTDLKEKLGKFDEAYKNADPLYIHPMIPRIVPDKNFDMFSFNEQLAYVEGTKEKCNLFGKMFHESTYSEGMSLAYQNQMTIAYTTQKDISVLYFTGLKKNMADISGLGAAAKTDGNTSSKAFNEAFKKMATANDALKLASEQKKDMKLIALAQPQEIPHYFETVDDFKKYKEKVNKALDATQKFLKVMNEEVMKGTSKFEDYQVLKAELDYYKKNGGASEEEINGKKNALNKLKNDPEIKKIQAALKAREQLTELKEKVEKLEKAAKDVKISSKKYLAYYERMKKNYNSDNAYLGSKLAKQKQANVQLINNNNKGKVFMQGIQNINKISRNNGLHLNF